MRTWEQVERSECSTNRHDPDVEFPDSARHQRAASHSSTVPIEDLGIDDYPLWTPSKPDTTDPDLIPDVSVPARPRTETLTKTQTLTIVTRPFPVSPYADIEKMLLCRIDEIHNTQEDPRQADQHISAIKHKLLVLARERSEVCSTDDEVNETDTLAPSIASSSDGYESEIEWESQSEAVLEIYSAASSSDGPGFSWGSQSEDLLDADADSISIGTCDELETPPQFAAGRCTWFFITLHTFADFSCPRAAIFQPSYFDRRESSVGGPESDKVAIEYDHGCSPLCSCMYDGAF